MRTREQEVEPLVNLSELTEIELLILRRLRELTLGEHRSSSHGSGYDLVDLREWQPGDRLSSIDWGQSTLTNFSPLLVRDFEQPSTANVVLVADASPSTRCGVGGISIAAAIARVIGTIGMSAVFFQDMFGLITFDAGFHRFQFVRSKTGKTQVIQCLDAYQHQRGMQELRDAGSISTTIAGSLRKTSLIPVVSDFLIEDPEQVMRELAFLNATHDVFIVLIDSGFAFEMPEISAGWIEAVDVETGRSRILSRKMLGDLTNRARQWQDTVARMAKDRDLDVVRLGIDELQASIALSEFIAERRLRRV
jgi:uncharacterized protein (DUF58 family)